MKNPDTKIQWTVCQGVISLNNFTVQLAFLHDSDLSSISQYFVSSSITLLFLLSYRRSFLEMVSTRNSSGSDPFLILFALLNLLLVILNLVFGWSWSLFLILLIFRLAQFIFDRSLFLAGSNPLIYALISLIGFVSFITMWIMQIRIGYCLLLSSVFLISGSIILGIQKKFKIYMIHNLDTIYWNRTRFLDTILNSSIGYLIPLLTLIVISEMALAQLRTAQLFLSIANPITSGIYTSQLFNPNKKVSNIYILLPAISVLMVYTGVQITSNIYNFQILQNYSQNTHLIIMPTIISLIIRTKSLIYSANLIRIRKERTVFNVNLWSSLFELFLLLVLFSFFGVKIFGIIQLLAASFQFYLFSVKRKELLNVA